MNRIAAVKYPYNFILGTLSVILIAGCAAVDTGYRAADAIAVKSRFEKEYIKTGLCSLTTLYSFTRAGAPLTVYIEGDGLAWRSRCELSDDPTPRHPLVLSLAAIDQSENVAYIARPGQLTLAGKPDCDPAYWSEKRFSQEVVNAINSAIDGLKAKSRSKNIDLIGYSGGAAIAVIIAAQRNDVTSIRTIAGNLDHEAVNRHHKVDSLEASLNPIDFAAKIAYIPQRHFASANDSVIPIAVTESFAGKIGDQKHESITMVKGTSHTAGWKKAWPSLIDMPLYKRDRSDE
jgi:hypothetical protein